MPIKFKHNMKFEDFADPDTTPEQAEAMVQLIRHTETSIDSGTPSGTTFRSVLGAEHLEVVKTIPFSLYELKAALTYTNPKAYTVRLWARTAMVDLYSDIGKYLKIDDYLSSEAMTISEELGIPHPGVPVPFLKYDKKTSSFLTKGGCVSNASPVILNNTAFISGNVHTYTTLTDDSESISDTIKNLAAKKAIADFDKGLMAKYSKELPQTAAQDLMEEVFVKEFKAMKAGEISYAKEKNYNTLASSKIAPLTHNVVLPDTDAPVKVKPTPSGIKVTGTIQKPLKEMPDEIRITSDNRYLARILVGTKYRYFHVADPLCVPTIRAVLKMKEAASEKA